MPGNPGIEPNTRRLRLIRLVKLSLLFALVFILLVFFDYSFNQVKLDQEYRFTVAELEDNRPVMLTQGAMIIILARYNSDFLATSLSELAIDTSISSRIDADGYFVALAYGTDLGCPVQIMGEVLKESCSHASYDLLGRSLDRDAYRDLEIPHYRWNKNFTALTIFQE